MYWRTIKELAEGPMQATAFEPYIDAWYAAFQTHGLTAQAPDSFKTWMATRRSYLQGELAA